MIFKGLAFLFFFLGTVKTKTNVTLYEHDYYGGASITLTNLEDYPYYSLSKLGFDNKASSFIIESGSCVQLYDNSPPGGLGGYALTSFDNAGPLEGKISSVKSCGSSRRKIVCPNGTFVKKIEWDKENELRNGIKLFCYKPDDENTPTVLSSHPDENFEGSQKMCTAIRGITFNRSVWKQADVGLNPECQLPITTIGNRLYCIENSALSGLELEIEFISNYIKDITYFCSTVGDITSICRAQDKKQTLFTCDATEWDTPRRCMVQKKVGYGMNSAPSPSMRTEFQFYSEFKFEMQNAGPGLSANFRSNVGLSRNTGHDWKNSQESTWSPEQTFTIAVEATPGCKTVVTEIVGECSFLVVRPYSIQRKDTCREGPSSNMRQWAMAISKILELTL